MQRKKDREELVDEFYLNKAQISRLLGVNPYIAYDLYEKADELDSQQLEFRTEPNKVRTKSVLKIAGITYEDLKKRFA